MSDLITFSSLVPVVIFKLLFAVLINGYNANTFLELKLKCIFHHHKHCRKVHKPGNIWLLNIYLNIKHFKKLHQQFHIMTSLLDEHPHISVAEPQPGGKKKCLVTHTLSDYREGIVLFLK